MKPFFTYIPASEILKSFFRTQCDENKFEGTPAIDSIVFFCRQDRIHGKNSVCFFGYFGGGDIQRPTQCVSGVQWRFIFKIFNGRFQELCGLFQRQCPYPLRMSPHRFRRFHRSSFDGLRIYSFASQYLLIIKRTV